GRRPRRGNTTTPTLAGAARPGPTAADAAPVDRRRFLGAARPGGQLPGDVYGPAHPASGVTHMATPRRNGAKPFSFMERLQEIGMFFEKRSKQHQTMRRLARRLKKAGIPYAIMGAMAVNAHGAERTTRDVDILLTADGLERFREEFVDEV